MTRKEKLIRRFLSEPVDFHFDELVTLLGYFEFRPVRKGKTSGSRVMFKHHSGARILLHKPHPSGIMKKYQLIQVRELLGL